MAAETITAEQNAWSWAWGGPWGAGGAGPVLAGDFERKAAPPPEDPKLVDIFTRHQGWTDAHVDNFEAALQKMVDAATKDTLAEITAALSTTDGSIDPTAANDKILGSADDLFMFQLNAEGYQELLKSYTGKFHEQLPFLQEMLSAIGDATGRDIPAVDFSPTDLKVLGRIQAATIGKLQSVFSGAASAAFDRVMFSVSRLPFAQLVTTLSDAMGKGVASARTWADTSVMLWHRTATSLAYDDIQADAPGDEALRFVYSGPDDRKTRVFCERLLVADKSYTRDEIDEMDNGQLPNVMVTCGGFSCRHVWVVALPGE